MTNGTSRSLRDWEDRLASFARELDFYVEEPVSCCDIRLFEEELASCRMWLREAQSFLSEERVSLIRSRIFDMEHKLDMLKKREMHSWAVRPL